MSGTMMTSTSLVLILISVLELSPATLGCRDGWQRFQGHCYTFIAQLLKYPAAARACRRHRAEIVEINSEEENEFIVSLLGSNKVGEAWLGINDVFYEGTWVSSTSEKRLTYTKWSPHQPDNYKGIENCAEIKTAHKAWFDLPCGARIWVICESTYWLY